VHQQAARAGAGQLGQRRLDVAVAAVVVADPGVEQVA